MKLLIIYLIFMALISCQQSSQHQGTLSSEPSPEQIIIADTGDASDTSGGTEVVGDIDKLNTYAPEFYSFNSSDNFSSEYQINIHYTGNKSIKLSEVVLQGFNDNMDNAEFIISSSTHPELFDNNIENYQSFNSSDGLLQVEVNLSDDILLSNISFIFDNDAANMYRIEVKHRKNNQFQKNYIADHLNDLRADFIKQQDITTFNVTHKNCKQGKKRNFDGTCYYPRILCTDFNSSFARGQQACAIKRDGVEVYCTPVDSKSECDLLAPQICTEAANYLTSFSQLFTLHHDDVQTASKVCNNAQVTKNTK